MADRRQTAGVTLHRFFLPPESLEGEDVLFTPDVGRQIRTVLRLRPGDRVVALDGSGAEYVVRLTDVGVAPRGVVEERRSNAAEPAAHVSLYLGVLKGAKFELVLQKCTELGICRFIPVMTARSIPAERWEGRRRRYEAIVREAAEQSGRGRLPTVSPTLSFREAVEEAARRGQVIVLWEEEQALRLSEVALHTAALSLFVGPEGGFTAGEATHAGDLGASIATLGRRILRAETAAIAGSALLLARLGELA